MIVGVATPGRDGQEAPTLKRKTRTGEATQPVKGTPPKVSSAASDPHRGATGKSSPSACVDPRARVLLLQYVMSACADGDALDFEVHLLGCAVCFADLKRLDRAATLVSQLKQLAPPPIAHAALAVPTPRRRTAS